MRDKGLEIKKGDEIISSQKHIPLLLNY